jgi:hypothetical protein
MRVEREETLEDGRFSAFERLALKPCGWPKLKKGSFIGSNRKVRAMTASWMLKHLRLDVTNKHRSCSKKL